MEALRVSAGWREPVSAAAHRLRAHRSSMAPIVRAGSPAALLTRSLAESALRHGLGAETCGSLACGGAPRVLADADLRRMRRAVLGTAPGLLVVARPGGAVRGVVPRHRLHDALEREGAARETADPLDGPSVAGALSHHLEPPGLHALEAAARLATAQGVPLYLVGGVVRDLLMGSDVTDLDLVIRGDGPVFASELGRVLGARVTIHDAFGTASLDAPSGVHLDVATARRESYTAPAALPRVESGSLLDDLMRRDVTVNSMAIRLDGPHWGHLVDELAGRADLSRRLLRVHHMLSLTEDPTRALRIARLAGRSGFRMAKETLESLRLAVRAGAFEALGGERLWRELGLLARERAPEAGLAACARMGLLRLLGPGLEWGAAERHRVARLTALRDAGSLERLAGSPDPPLLLVMSLSLVATGRQKAALAERLRLRGEPSDRLQACGEAVGRLRSALARARGPSRVVRACEQAPPEALAIVWASGPRRAARAVQTYLKELRDVRPSITGEYLRALGLPPGPAYQAALRALRDALLDGRVTPGPGEMALARRLVAALRGAPAEDPRRARRRPR